MSLVLEQVRRVVGKDLWIADTTLELAAQGLYVLLGPTLAGKTSLMRLMAGLDRPSAGRVLVDGVDVTGKAVRQRSVAMVYQQFINYPTLTAYENIASPLRLQGRAKADIERRVRDTARLLHIEHLLERTPAELSGGQQQRLAIARALVKDARLLLLDEPLVNLDYKLREELRSELRDLFARQRTTVVYATTEPLEALIMGGNVLVMDRGRVLQAGPTLEVYHRPASLAVAAVFSDPPINTIWGKVEDGHAVLGAGVRIPLSHHLQGLGGGRYRFGVRANHLAMQHRGHHDVAIPGEVELAEISGSETFVHVHHNDVSWVVQQEGVHSYALGEAVRIHVDPARLYVFAEDGTLAAAPERPA